MTSGRARFIAGVIAIALVLVSLSCSERTVTGPGGRALVPGGPSRSVDPGLFSWIAPLGTGSANPTTFDPTAVSRVEICVWTSGACSGAPVAQFAITPGPGVGALTANTTVGEYEATWSLLGSSLLVRRTYRIRAMQGAVEVGGILVDVVRGRWGLTRSDGQPAALGAATELPIRFHVALPPLALVKINEIESSGGTPDDWIELYNPTSSPIDLSSFVIKDNQDDHVFVVPAGTVIAPNGYLVFDTGSNPGQFDFGLGAPDAARLFDTFGRLVDSYAWDAHAATTTYGRCPNGTGAFVNTTTVTKGTANDCTVAVKINEIESNGGSPDDWIELYNPGSSTVDLGGYVIKDNDNADVFTIPAGTTIAAKGFLVFDKGTAANQFTFGLGSGDQVRFFDPAGNLLDSYTWSSHAVNTYGRCPDGTGAFVDTFGSTKGAANSCTNPSPLKINEVESSDGSNPDWIELYNTSGGPVDLSGFTLGDNDGNSFTIPTGTSIPAHGFLAFDALGFGLGGADGARLLNASGTLLDSYSWTAHASTTYGRCPDGTGDFATTSNGTKGAANACPLSAAAWPGGGDVFTVDVANTFTSNLSGLMYEVGTGGAADVLWGARNGSPSAMYRLRFDGTNWVSDPANGWGSGKLLRYKNGTGQPDAEDLTFTTGSSAGMYVATERNNDVSSTSKPTILRFDVTGSSAELVATHEWDLTADLPPLGENLGLEGITWIPDSYLVAKGFVDSTAGHLYNPAEYPDHAGGLFFVGVEQNGIIYAYALNHTTGAFKRITSFSTGFPLGVMSLQFDRELEYLWATCDNTCHGLSDIFEIDTTPGSPTLGQMKLTHIFSRPAGMGDFNNEGFAFTPLSLCSGGLRKAFWADDTNDAGHAIRQGTIPCAKFP